MKKTWFKPAGFLFPPVHPIGFVVTMLALVFLIPVCTAIVRNGHSASDAMYHLFIYTTCTAFWWKWIAEKTSNQ